MRRLHHELAPALDVTSNWNSNAFGFHAESDIAGHMELVHDDTHYVTVQVNGRLDIFHDQTLALQAGYQALHEDRSSPDSIAQAQQVGAGALALTPTPFSVLNGQFDYVYSPTRIGFELIGGVNKYAFSNVQTGTGELIVNSDQNREEYTLTPRISYSFDANYKVFVQATGDIRSYDTARDASPDHFQAQFVRLRHRRRQFVRYRPRDHRAVLYRLPERRRRPAAELDRWRGVRRLGAVERHPADLAEALRRPVDPGDHSAGRIRPIRHHRRGVGPA